MATHRQVAEPSPTIVGPRPEGTAGGQLSVPRGMEQLLILAGLSPAWRDKVLTDPLGTAAEARIELSASERAILGSIPRPALAGMASSLRKRMATRHAAPLRAAAAAVATAALLATGLGGEAKAAAPSLGVWVQVAPEVTILCINPNFTLVNLVDKADLILVLRIAPADEKGIARAEVVKALKGKAGKSQVIDLSRSANAEHAKAIRELIRTNGDGPALLFVGKGIRDEALSRLHLGGKWVGLDKAERAADAWEADVVDSQMEATWAGGTDMLLKHIELLAQFPDTDVPVSCAGSWEEPVQVGKVEGRVRAALAVDLAGRGELALFVASEGGDKVFAYDRKTKKYEDVTARLGLVSKSSFAAWGNFGGNGRLDLASSDGKGLVIWSQAADGTFSSSAVAGAPKESCTGLAAVDVGQKGRAGLVWGSAAGPVLLVPEAGKPGGFALKPLKAADGALKDQAGAGAPLVADFDGDGLPDIVLPFAKGSLFFRGQGGGEFAEGTACDIRLGEGRTAAFLGDFDMDGRLDVMTVAGDQPRLWQNSGGGRFKDEFMLSGEITYIARPGAIGGNTGDINNDGRPDVFLFYGPEAETNAHIFFNRGFRSLMHAHQPVDLAESQKLPEAAKGQQAGVLADFNGDGAQDMALVLADGTVQVLAQAVKPDDPQPALRVALAPGAATAGPVTVSARNDRRPLGAWAVSPGMGEAHFARADGGEITVTWQLPGKPPQKKLFLLENKPIRFVIGAD